MKQISVPNAELFSEAGRLLSEGKEVTILARGNSMLPFIRGGVDKVTLASVPAAGRQDGGGVPGAQGGEGFQGTQGGEGFQETPSGITPGDILLCEISPGHFVLHRLIRIDGERLTLMGDGNLRGVEHCMRAHVIARAVRIIRPDGSSADCCSPSELRKARLWRRLLPLRRILLAVWRRTR